MRAPLVPKPLALALALGTLAAHGAAQARSDWISRCSAGYYEQGVGAECQQPYQEGLAAVLTGSADDDAGAWGYLDKQGRMAIAPAYTDAESFQNGLAAVSQGELWGYIDRQGRWAIEPRYARATGFNAEGTALVEDDGRDVLIDRQGKVVKIFPLGTRSWGFQRGQKLAAMEMPLPPRLVNAVTGKAATLPEGVMRLAAPTGGYLPAQLRDTRYGGWWGLLDANGGWAITPQTLQSREAPIRDGDVIAVVRDDRWLFVDPRGQAISSARYRQLQVVAPGVWLAKTGRSGKAVLLDGRQKVLHRFASEYVGLQERDGWRYLIDENAIVLVDPADKLMTIAVGQGRVDVRDGEAWVSGAQAGNGAAEGAAQAGADASAHAGAQALEQAGLEVAAMPAEAQVAATAAEPEAVEAAATAAEAAATEAGAVDAAAADAAAADAAVADAAAADAAVADAAAAGAAVADAADAADDAADAVADVAAPAPPSPPRMASMRAVAAASAAASGVEISEGGLVQIYTREGKPLLDAATVAQLRAYHVNAFDAGRRAQRGGPQAKLPLALLRPNDYSQPMGILTASGKIVTNADWESISSYDVSLPLPVRTRDRKTGAIDAEGNWAIPPRYTEIRPFRGAYSWASLPGSGRREIVLIDARGKPVAVPAEVLEDTREFDGELIHYRAPDENRERLWGVWNVRDGAPVLKPVYERIEEFEDDWAKVLDHGRWGVVNRKGHWVLPATYESAYEMEYLGDGLLLVPDADAQAGRGYSDRAYRLVNLRTGKTSERLAGKPEKLKDGRYIGELADAGTILFDARGGALRLSDTRPRNKVQYQDWIYIENEEREGAINARGELKVPALYGEFNPFFVQPEGLARAYDGSEYRVIDQTGKALPTKLGDGTPLAGMKRIVFQDDRDSGSVMTDLQGREVTRIPGTYSVQYRSASEGVVPYRGDGGNGRYGFVDANGKRVVGPHFDSLGPLKNGLAAAQRRQRTGKLYGYIDLTGRYAIPPLFSWVSDFQEERALVRQDGYTQYIDTKGEPLATFVTVCDTVTILDNVGRIVWPLEKMSCPTADKFELAPDNAKAKQS